MHARSKNIRIALFRNHPIVWMLLTILLGAFCPRMSVAQPFTAIMSSVSGIVLVNGQSQGTGTVLTAGDVIETQADTQVVLTLSDDSLLELGENTKLDIMRLSQTVTETRGSRIKLAWGRVRAILSPDYQQAGSSFEIETPNALVGVKFSHPDVEVWYDPTTQETLGIAHTVELVAKNVVTGEEQRVPVGSTVIITAVTIKILAGTTGVGTISVGISTGTKVALGVGAVAAAGGVAALTGGSEGRCEAAECTGDISGTWRVKITNEYLSSPDCIDSLLTSGEHTWAVIQTGSTFSSNFGSGTTLYGTIRGNVINWTVAMSGTTCDDVVNFEGSLKDNTIISNYELFL